MTAGKINKTAILATILSLLPLCNAWASYRITGEVKDKKNREPVAGAFVLAYADNTQKGFAYSGEEGQFSLNIADGVAINTIKVSMMGYAATTIATEGRTSGIVVELEKQAMQIHPASVKSAPIRRTGDTLSFYVQAFSDGTEQVLGDLIDKIPGLTTNESGTILYEGESINKFYVEDLDLMGNRYGVVTKNLKAGDVARVDVYLNHQPVNALKDLNPTDKSAVNIVLKESARGSWVFTGDALLGLPPFPLFDAKSMFTRFSKKNQDLYLIKGNNLGTDIALELREQPGAGRTGSFLINGSIDNDLSSTINPSTTSLPIPKSYWYDNTSGIATFNHLSKTGQYSKLRLSLNTAAEKYNEASSSTETVNFDDGTVMTISDGKSLTDRKYYFHGQADYEDNSPTRFISETFSLTGQIRKDVSDGDGRSTYTQDYDLPSFKAQNDLSLTLRHGERAITINSTATYIRNSHSAVYNTHGNTYNQTYIQNDLTSSHSTGMNILTGKHKIDLNATIGLDNTDHQSSLSGMGPDNITDHLSVLSITPALSVKDVITLGNISLTANLPASLHILLISGRDNITYPQFSPSLSIRHTLSTKLETRARVGYNISRSSPSTLLNAMIMKNYRTLSLPDSLNRSARISANASLRYSDHINMLFMDITGGFNQTHRSKTTSSQYTDDFTLTRYLPSPNAATTYTVNGRICKYFGVKTLMLEATSGYSHSDMEEYLQQIQVEYTTRSINAGLSVRSVPASWIAITLKSNYTRQISHRRGTDVISHILTGEGSLRISPHKKIDLDLNGCFLREQIPGVTVHDRPLLKVTISRRLNKGTAYFECRNILDIDEYRRETISSYRTISSSTHLRGREFLAGIRMSL